jgi:hypothetical protein
MLTLRVVRGPLQPHENEAILGEYNRLTSSRIPLPEFLHWIQDGPAGAACHAMLETGEGKIVAHTSLIPMRASLRGELTVAAKSEYSFILEECRSTKIRGMEQLTRLKNLTLIEELFRHCRALGWEPLFISTNPAVHRLYRSVGCYPVEFPVWECLLVLRPWSAARETPNLSKRQRYALLLAGNLQSLAWLPAAPFAGSSAGTEFVSIDGGHAGGETEALSFFADRESLQWRFPGGQYQRLDSGAPGHEQVIVKKGSADRYLRVCQWRLETAGPPLAMVARLVRMAREEKALGVRWAMYGDGEAARKFTRRMRSLGFLCARRVRTLLVSSENKEFLDAKNWQLNDAMFSFDP